LSRRPGRGLRPGALVRGHQPARRSALRRPRSPHPHRGHGVRRLRWPLLLPALPVIVAVAAALLAPWVAPASPTSGNLAARLRPPAWISGGSGARLLGTDLLGRDLLSRLIWGARISLLIALAATVLGAVVGSLIGLVSGYYRGRIDRVVTKLIDVQLAFPFVLLAIAVIAVAGASIPVLVIVLAIGSWVGHARIIRGLVLSLRERDYVQAARALGADTPRILFRHLLPEILSVILILATFDVGRIIILESTLSFLGLGVQPPTPSWGSDLRDAAAYVRQAWWTSVFPGLAIMVVVLGVNLVGDAPGDATTMDPGRSTQVLTVNYFFNLYDTLTRWDAALKLHPGLATSWKAINDTTWEVRLRPDVKFHDGSPLTAEDVKAVYERNMVPGKTVVQSGFATLESVQAVNPTTLRIVTRKPDPLVPVRMAQMGGSIYPARFTSDEGARELARKPIGSGAYKFVSWTKDGQLVMEANRDWWGWNGRPAA